jgi:hypothetical protein
MQLFPKDSETILIARAKFAVGTLFQVMSQMDVTPLLSILHIDPKYLIVWQILSAWLIADGLMCEWARRRRDPDMH